MALSFTGPDVEAQAGTEDVAFVFNKDPNDTDVFERFTDGPAIYTLQSGTLPTGMSINGTTGNPEGTPTQTGTFADIIVRCTKT